MCKTERSHLQLQQKKENEEKSSAKHTKKINTNTKKRK
jgi:hypothetical protein